jgi:hypothetical protein
MSDVKKKRVSAAEFVTVWQNAETMTDVCEALEMKPGTAQVRASTYRKKGVLLKKFAKGGKSFDVNALNELIADIETPVLGNVDVDTAADEEAA